MPNREGLVREKRLGHTPFAEIYPNNQNLEYKRLKFIKVYQIQMLRKTCEKYEQPKQLHIFGYTSK